MNEYEKGKEIGRGAFGAVFAARRRRDGAEVAIKRVHAGVGSDGVDFTALREISALSQCDCDNVLRLLDVFAAKDKILLVMELMTLDLHKVFLPFCWGFCSHTNNSGHWKQAVSSFDWVCQGVRGANVARARSFAQQVDFASRHQAVQLAADKGRSAQTGRFGNESKLGSGGRSAVSTGCHAPVSCSGTALRSAIVRIVSLPSLVCSLFRKIRCFCN
jgi:hypothetical protein